MHNDCDGNNNISKIIIIEDYTVTKKGNKWYGNKLK